MPHYIHPTQDAGLAFYQQFHEQGQVVMLNLLRFRETADYSASEDLRPSESISGKEAYDLYMKHTLPLLEKAGSKLLFYGKGFPFMIGPEEETWDAVLLVQHESATAFIGFAQDADYLATAGHRTAALEDSRLLPIEQLPSS